MVRQRTWQDNAEEFALMDKGEGWPFARLIACSVERGNGQGARAPRSDRTEVGKVSANQFAEQAGTSRSRVVRYLEAWDAAAAQGLCSPSTDLGPADSLTVVEPDIAWERIYDASKAGGRPRDSRPEDAATILARRGAQAVVDAMTREQQEELAQAIAAVNPAAVETAANPDIADTERTMRRMDRENDAWESQADRGTARGGEHETRAMLEVQWLHDNGHREGVERVVEFGRGLLDIDRVADLTPEMFHE